jgi:hypothetical protein
MDYVILFIFIGFIIILINKDYNQEKKEHFDFIETPANPLWWWKAGNTVIYGTVKMGCRVNEFIGSGLKRIGLAFDV